MSSYQEAGRHLPKLPKPHIPHVSPRDVAGAGLVGLALAGSGVAGAALDRYVLTPNAQTIDRSSFSTGQEGDPVLIPEILPGQEVKPIPGSVIKQEQSGFQNRQFEVIRTVEEMQEVLLRIRDVRGRPIDYPFDPATSVAVLATLGRAERLENDDITGVTVTEKGGVLVVRLERTESFTSHHPQDSFSTKDTSPVYLVTFPRVALKGRELSWQTTVNDKVDFISTQPSLQ